jgi:hypothetical protein
VNARGRRQARRRAELRLAAAVLLAPRLVVCEALLAGVPVPAGRLDGRWARALGLADNVVLDDALAFAVAAHGPIGGGS